MISRLMLSCLVLLSMGGLVFAEDVDVTLLIKNLNSGTESAYDAADDLSDVATDEVVQALIATVDSEDVELSRRSIRALGKLGPAASPAVASLTKQLDSDSIQIRAYAAYALGEIGETNPEMIAKLIELVGHERPIVRRTVLKALLKLDVDPEVSLPIFVRMLENSDPSTVMTVLHQLADMGPQSIPRLKRALEHDRAAYWATLVAAEMGSDAAPLVPELTKALDNKDPQTRMHALIALGEIGPESKPAMERGIELLNSDKAMSVKYAAAYALAAMEQPTATSALEEAAKHEDSFLKLMSIYAIAKLHPEDTEKTKTAAAYLIQAMSDENPNVRAAAARAIANLEISSNELRPMIKKALKDADPRVVANFQDAVVNMGVDVLPDVVGLLDDAELRWAAIRIIGQWGSEAGSASPSLKKLLAEEDEQLQAEVLMALGSLGESAGEVTGEIRPFVNSDSRVLQLNAMYALGRIGPAAAEAKADVLPLIASDDNFTKFAAAWTLAHIVPEDADAAAIAVPVLAKGLEAEDEFISSEAAKSLGNFGSLAKSALPALKKAASAGNENATAAIKQVQ